VPRPARTRPVLRPHALRPRKVRGGEHGFPRGICNFFRRLASGAHGRTQPAAAALQESGAFDLNRVIGSAKETLPNERGGLL
jgi:hypothetical protein